MDRDGENIPGQPVKLSRMPPLQSIPNITREVMDSYRERERGCRSMKTLTVSTSLKACAEDELVKKEYKEMRCGIPGLTKSTFLMVFSPDGTKMASTHGNHNVYVTDLRTGKNIKTLVGHPRTPWCVAFHPSSNQILASGCLGGQVRIWDLSGGSEVWTADSQTVISSLAFHPVDRLLVIATCNELYFWDWSQPKPFMQTCTSNAKEKVRYVAFDRLGHKLITGIANTPQGFTRWERVRAPVPVARHSDRITAYRRRITPRLVPPPSPSSHQPSGIPGSPTTPPEPANLNLNSIPERERRIAVCYRNLVEQYEMLVQRYLEVYRPATTIDRGTDPMEAEHLQNSGTTTSVTTSTPNVATSGPSTSSTPTVTAARSSPISIPGPSGLSRQNTRPSKRPNTNVHSSKSDLSTVYQSDSSSSSDSDETPTPKRRISLVPNSNMFRKQEPNNGVKVTDSSTSTTEKFDKRKKLFMSRSSAFHLTRSWSSQNISGMSHPPEKNYPIQYLANRQISGNRNGSLPNRRTFTTEEFLSMLPDLPGSSRSNRNEQSSQSDNPVTEERDANQQTDLPLPLSRLRGISEGSLSSADEVINFSERSGREEPSESAPPENPDPNEFSIENIYRNILSDLETVRNTSRNSDVNRTNSETSNILQSFSQRLENIMNQSDAILANLRQSMDILMEPSNQQSQPTNSSSEPPSARPFTLRRPSGFHSRQYLSRHGNVISRGTSQSGPSPQAVRFPGSRSNRYRPHIRTSRPVNMNMFEQMWRPFGDHNYPRDPENGEQGRSSNVEPIGSLLTLSPRSPSREINQDNEIEEATAEPVRSSTPVPFPPDHNYPLFESPRIESSTIEYHLDPSTNPIADHTYPRDPQSSNRASSDYLQPLVSSLHSTISHIAMQTNLLRRQVESIELIDRARFEVFQLQEMRRMWEDIRRHISFLNTPLSDRRANNSNMSNVRQMMAWTRISDPSPSSESAQSSTEQSTPEPSPSTPDVPTPSTSRSSASSSNESRPTLNPNSPSYLMARIRQNHIKKRPQSRFYWRRRCLRNESPNFAPRRFNRSFNQYRDNMASRSNRTPDNRDPNLTEVTVSLMIRGLESLIMQQTRLFGRLAHSPDRSSIERRVLSERVIQNRLRSARNRLNQLNGFESHANSYLDEPVEFSALGSRNDWCRYEARLKLSVYIETFSRFVENRASPIPPALGDQIKILIELTLLLTDLLLLQIMENIPSSSGSFLDPERETLASRIEQLCTGMLQTIPHSRSASLSRLLHSLRLTARYMISSLRLSGRNDRQNTGFRSHYRNYRREAMLDLNRQLRNLYQYSNYLDESDLPTPNEAGPSTSQNSNNASNSQSMSHVYRLGDLLARLRSVRGRLEQVSQNSLNGRLNNNSSSTTEHDPARSTDESPSDRESESFEGFQSDIANVYRDPPGTLYRTSHVNLYPPEQSSSQSSPERVPPTGPTPTRLERPWNVPTVQVNDVPVTNTESSTPANWHPRMWANRYMDHIRPLSAATGLFRPRFLIPLYAGVNPFDADLDEGQREPPGSYDGVMTATVSPNHRIQMWDISKCYIPNISNHEKNIVVSECKIHNDGSVDISRDGTLLVTLLPSGGYLNVTNRLGIYSIKWDTLGQCLYTTSFEQNAISVSLSPISRHLIVGLASRRVTLLPSDRWTMARIFLLDDRKIKIAGRGRLVVLRDLEQGRDRDLNFMSVNCIKWIPVSGQGIVYATNTGQLRVLT